MSRGPAAVGRGYLAIWLGVFVSSSSIYPPALLGLLRRAWRASRLYVEDEAVPSFPPAAQVQTLLDVAYHASLLHEEKRQLTFGVTLCPSSEFESQAAQARWRGATPLRLARPVPYTDRQLLRLAPSTDPNAAIVAVEPAGDANTDGALRIWGLLDIGSSWWEHARRESVRDVRTPPDYLTVTSARPGQLTLSRASRVLVRLENGRLAPSPVDVFLKGPVARAFQPAQADLYRKIYPPAVRGHRPSYESAVNQHNCAVKYLNCVRRLLTYVHDRGHGGIFAFIPESAREDARLNPLMSPKYPVLGYEAWTALAASLDAQRQWLDLGDALSDQHDHAFSAARGRVMEFASLRRVVAEHDFTLTDRLRLIAALSGVDGAVVLTDRFSLMGFGVELRADAGAAAGAMYVRRAPHADVTPQQVATFDRVPAETWGTRHRAAFRFCHAWPKAVVFVLSQDGALKAVRRVGREVVYWDLDPFEWFAA